VLCCCVDAAVYSCLHVLGMRTPEYIYRCMHSAVSRSRVLLRGVSREAVEVVLLALVGFCGSAGF
jgi:hypothetical protein